jgi:hypothetical protein
MNVGVMKDYKLRDLRASHTLGWSGAASRFFFKKEKFRKVKNKSD